MNFDSITNQIYIVAFNEAKLQMHEYLCPEHILYSTLLFGLGREMIERSGGNPEKIMQALQTFFNQHVPKRETVEPVESAGLIFLIESAVRHANHSGKKEVNIGDVIVSFFELPESFAVYILKNNGVNKLALLNYIAHGLKLETEQSHSTTNKKNKDQEFMNTYAMNLTERARAGKLDKLIGREDILTRTIQVLCRRIKNNPIHIGEPGVGKTAIVEGIAQLIAGNKVPKPIQNANVYYIEISNIIAGTKYRGDFEERFLKLLELISKEENPIVYIDEIHTVVGAGAVSGSSVDAAGILKPYLAKGEVRFIGSTTFDEYKKHFEKDRAFSRRFQKIEVPEPTVEETIGIIEGIKEKYEAYHNVVYKKEIIEHVCKLADKYIQDRFLPDKAIDIIDETAALLRMNVQTEAPIIIQKEDVEKTISLTAKIPTESISSNEIDKLRNLSENLKKEIFGQDEAVEVIVSAIKSARSGLNEFEKPVASFLFVGPTGVGKTEVSKQLANLLGISLLRYDMSEYQEKHAVSRLIGAPPGYVGYEEGGLLTDAIKRTPYCVLLLDEVEKAHPDILNVLLQVMDYGSLTDNAGKKADFRNVILIMTSNAGATELGRRIIGFEEKVTKNEVIDKAVNKTFSPEFRNRLDEIVIFNGIDEKMAHAIAIKAIGKLQNRLKDKKIKMEATDDVIKYIVEKGISNIYGAREIMRVVEKDIKKKLTDYVLFGELAEGSKLYIDLRNGEIHVSKRKKRKSEADMKKINRSL